MASNGWTLGQQLFLVVCTCAMRINLRSVTGLMGD